MSATDRTDQQRANRQEELSFSVKLRAFIQEWLQLMGIDPALAVSLQIDEKAAAEFAADEVHYAL